MKTTSREWANFKRRFIGPTMPRKIRKLRQAALPPTIPFTGPVNTPLPFDDCRKLWNRRETHKLAMPKWANQEKIKEIYNTAKELNKTTGIIYHVDHIIPIRHPLVCGLHVECNLQILTAAENSQKSNFFIIE
jgi:hypothetical protein